MSSPPPTFLFVPGAWHTPPCFDAIRADLTRRGIPSTAAKLVSVGSADPANQGIAQDAASIRSTLEPLVDAGKEVVVVCHSYGGVPTSSAVEGFNLADRVARGEKGGVKMVIYMASFALPVGESLMSGLKGETPAWWTIDGDVVTIHNPIPTFYADVSPELTAKAVAAIEPMSVRPLSDKTTFAPWAHGFKMGYIFCEDDQAIALELQKGMASQFPEGSFTASLKCSHSPFLSVPEKLGDVLVEAVKS